MEKRNLDLVIIGAGPAGYSAAIYATRYKLETIIIADEVGGLLVNADVVENYPGFPSILGKDLMNKLKMHSESLGVVTINDKVTNISKNESGFKISCKNANFITKAICFATGTKRKKLNIPGEEENIGMGVSYCATCDAPFFKNRTCCVIGGSDSAAKEALVLSRVAKKVHVIYRRSKLRAEPLLSEKVYNTKNINVIHDANIVEICTNEHGIVDKVILDDGSSIETNGVFIEIGFNPRSELASGIGVNLNEKGEIIVDDNGKTNVPGVFAAGDVTNHELKQAITAAADGAKASWAAYQYITLHCLENG
ncbi:MAG: NAD(P)/FAD-dependent oxidoreductase [Promethearchaeota archaeon]